MQKIGFSLQNSYTAPIPEVLRLLKAVGFDAVSPVWQRDVNLKELVDTAAACGLILQSLHAPFRGLPEMWRQGEAPILQDLLRSAEDCAHYGIPVLVVHSWGGLDYTFREADLHFDNFDRLVEYAHSKGLQIAFENLEGPEYLCALLDRYGDVGLCWDSGHELCYTPNWDLLQKYGDRLWMTHLNDNLGITSADGQLLGTDDLHLLPYDGIAHWPRTVHRLKQARKQEILNFELKIRPKGDRCTKDLYSKMPLEQYLEKAYRTASRATADYFE